VWVISFYYFNKFVWILLSNHEIYVDFPFTFSLFRGFVLLFRFVAGSIYSLVLVCSLYAPPSSRIEVAFNFLPGYYFAFGSFSFDSLSSCPSYGLCLTAFALSSPWASISGRSRLLVTYTKLFPYQKSTLRYHPSDSISFPIT
jgi:hypothetical protein